MISFIITFMTILGILMLIVLAPAILFGAFLSTPIGTVVAGIINWCLGMIVPVCLVVGAFVVIGGILSLFGGDK
ncbi:hypothetical protein KIH79_11070 [Bifidobacterium sp. 82T10]|uniref:Uncharacterized protein n=1 Tax=Bifidobacterium miconis TaxID=2834435 RepID=A0ABS6WHB5_9BIFI|nr:hypothetical protein [Bifidobacterium miconis]MBW3093450.1 hypothetical protein [Bifidobacterium miconis]